MKKLTAILLAVLMAALPLFAVAESPLAALGQAIENGEPMEVTVSFTPGEALAADADLKPLADLLDAMALVGTVQRDAGMFRLMLSGTDVLDLVSVQQGGTLTLASNLLGQDAVSLKESELEALLPRLVDAMVRLNLLTADDAAYVKEILTALSAEVQMPAAQLEITPESIEALGTTFGDLAARLTFADVTAQPKGCDAAEKMATLTLTGEDVVKTLEAYIAFFKANPALLNQMQTSLAMVGETDSIEQELDEALAELKAHVGDIEDIPVSLYLDKDDVPVYGTMQAALREDDERLVMDMAYTRLTTGEGVSHSATLTAKEVEQGKENSDEAVAVTLNVLDGEARMLVTFDVVETEEGKDDEPELSLSAELIKNRTDNTIKDHATLDVTIYDDGNADTLRIAADIDAAVTDDGVTLTMPVAFTVNADKPQLTINLNVKPCEALTAPANTIAPAQMSDDELDAWVMQVIQNASVALVTMVQSLPSSILMMLSGT